MIGCSERSILTILSVVLIGGTFVVLVPASFQPAFAANASLNVGIIGGSTLPATGDVKCTQNPWTDASNIMTGTLFDSDVDPITCLPTTTSNFTDFNFIPISLPITDLSGYDTVVLNLASPALWNGDNQHPDCEITNLSVDDEDALVTFLVSGGKLIIYDSECSTVDYSWLPHNLQFETFNPGNGGNFGSGKIVENNTLSSAVPGSDSEIFMGAPNTIDDGLCNSVDACGDANVMITLSSDLCRDIDVSAVGEQVVTGTTHAYSREGAAGTGLLIYNGLDLDKAQANTIPRTSGVGALAKLFLLELKQSWNPTGLLCSESVGTEAPTPAQLTVIKHVINDNGGTATAEDFTISVEGNNPSLSSFSGDENGVVVDLRTGTFSVTESAEGNPSGYTSSMSGDCSGIIGDGETKTCTITNDDIQPLITVTKEVTNDNGGSVLVSDFALSIGNQPLTSGVQLGVDAGTYTISEAGPSGYLASFSGDCTVVGSITLAPGGIYECTITNDDIQPKLTVIKHVITDDGGSASASDFTISISGGPTTVIPFDGAESPGTTVGLDVGTYSISESGPEGYAQSISGSCDPETGSITLALGDDLTCTITNDDIAIPPQPALLTIIKRIVNDDGGNAILADFTLMIDGQPVANNTAIEVGAGTAHTVSESASQEQDGKYSATFSDNCPAGVITVQSGESLICTITNNDITPPENNVPSADAGPDRSVNENDEITLTGSATDADEGDTLTFSWTQIGDGPTVSITGSDTLSPSFITPSVDEDTEITLRLTVTDNHGSSSSDDVNVTILNVIQPAHLIVVKHVNSDDGGTASASDFTITINGVTATGGNSFAGAESPGVDKVVTTGEYSVTEEDVGPSGYSATYSEECTGAISEGQTKTCTITNDDIPAKITIVKSVINDDGGTQTDFNSFIRLDGVVVGTGTFEHDAGSYSVTEDAVEGYQTTLGDNCSGTLGNGQEVTCTITNDDIAPPPPANTPGKITAGGAQISKDVNFGFNVQSTDGETIKGQLEYQDKASNINLHSVEMTSIQVSAEGKHGIFTGTATINGKAGYSFTIIVEDNGEPGRQDTFEIKIAELNYDVSGTLVKGNIQIHKN